MSTKKNRQTNAIFVCTYLIVNDILQSLLLKIVEIPEINRIIKLSRFQNNI